MSHKEHTIPKNQDFDHLLQTLVDDPIPTEISPWKKAMDRVLWGVGLTTMTLNFWNLDTILPGLGLIMALLGFRSLRKDNPWFSLGYVLSVIRVIWFVLCLFLQSTVYAGEQPIRDILQIGSYLMVIPGFLVLLSLRNGIRRVQIKAVMSPHGGTGLVIWYGIVLILGLLSYTGIAGWGLMIAYIFIIRNLIALPGELEEAGYMISPAPVKWSDLTVKIAYAAIIMVSLLIGYCFCSHHPMNWQEYTPHETTATAEIKQRLTELGFPKYVLEDMTEDEIAALDGADFIIVNGHDYDVDQNVPILTAKEIAAERMNGITEEEGQRQLRTTFIGVRFPRDKERWTIIHHFMWLTDRKFCGTEAIQMWPTDHVEGWHKTGDFQGRVLYDFDGITYASDYHSLGEITYETTDLTATMLGQTSSTDVYATFSLPSGDKNQRGYVLYDVEEMTDGYIIDSWFNYVHQNHPLQFPVQSAKEYKMTAFLDSRNVFTTIQTALQFTTHGEVPELF